MSAPLNLWIMRVLWLALPFTLLNSIVDATSGAPDAVRLTTQTIFWVVWAAAFLVSLVPVPSTLTALRVLVPLAPAASLAAAMVSIADIAGWIGLGLATIATAAVASSPVGDWFVDGASYGDERRFALRPPVALLLGPLPLAWILTVAPMLTGAILFANSVYVVGGLLIVIGIATAWWGSFAMWRLARRWLVFVPAGVTIVDDMALAEPVLIARRAVARFGPAHVGSEALDLSVGAPGLVLELALKGPVELVPAVDRRDAADGQKTRRRARARAVKDPVEVDAVLVVPSRPGAVLDHAEDKSLPVARD